MKIGIVGSGMVGSAAAFAMIMKGGIGREIVLVDKNEQRARAEANDLFHAVPFASPMKIRAGGFPDLAGCKMVVISAGASQKPGETRRNLLKRNADVFSQIVPRILTWAPDTVLVVATNPLDIMTHITARFGKEHDAPPRRVLGTGTMLDTARFRSLLGRHLGVDPQHVHAYVIGEHGDSEVLSWSLVTVGGVPLGQYCAQQRIVLDDSLRGSIDADVRNAAYQIIAGKGATYYGIGSALAKLADVILHDQRAILTVSTPMPSVAGVENVSVSLPQLVGGEGVIASIPLPLDSREEAALRDSAALIREAVDTVFAS